MINKFPYLIFIVAVFISANLCGQGMAFQENCTQFFDDSYISDGQQYRALLNGEEVAEFHATFYEGNRYRIVACGARTSDNIVFNVYDHERNLLFSNRDFDTTPFWDFYFNSTVDCIIEARLDANVQTSGLAMLLIGFKQ